MIEGEGIDRSMELVETKQEELTSSELIAGFSFGVLLTLIPITLILSLIWN